MKKLNLLLCAFLLIGFTSCVKDEQVDDTLTNDVSTVVDLEALGFNKVKDPDIIKKLQNNSNKSSVTGYYPVNLEATTTKFLTVNQFGWPTFSASSAGSGERWYLASLSNGKFQLYSPSFQLLRYSSNPLSLVGFSGSFSEWDLKFNATLGSSPYIFGFQANHGSYLEYGTYGSSGYMTSRASQIDLTSGINLISL